VDPAGSALALQSSFDAAVAVLRAAQQQLAVDLKAAEGRLLMMLKELALLTVCVQAPAPAETEQHELFVTQTLDPKP
jgi:hypothetical protein